MRKYLFLVSLTYGFPILRPIQNAIRARGGEAAWFLDEPGLEKFLRPGERRLRSVKEVMEFAPDAVITAGNHMYHFFPGAKVEVFHGFNIDKRPGRGDHFDLKGWFDIYCTQGETSTPEFQRLAEKYGYFEVAETGWPKLDGFFGPDGTIPAPHNKKPVILYSSTFTSWITSTPYLFDEIERLIKTGEWEWMITFHPKMDPATVARYRALAEKYDNATYYDSDNNIELLLKADAMVCDSSSIIVEFLYLYKPVVTFRNTAPGPWLIDIGDPSLLEGAIREALMRPQVLMDDIHDYLAVINPYRDGHSSDRVLDAIDDFIARGGRSGLKHKPLNLLRKFKARKKLRYWKL